MAVEVPCTAALDDEASATQSPLGDLAAVFEDPVWAEVYAACCCDTGEALSLERARSFQDAILAQNHETQRERLSLRCLRIGITAVSCLALQLKDRNYTRVDLSNNQLGDHAVLSVRSLMRALPRLRWLGLAGNLISAEGARELAEELESNDLLEGLGLGGIEPGPQGRGFRPNAVGADGLQAVLDAMKRNPNPSLTSLVLCHTSLSAEAGRHLAAFLEQDQGRLQHLDLSSNPLSSEGICALLPHCTRLRVLDIADTGCRGELIHSRLCTMLQRSSDLTHLSLAQNPLETRPLRRIVRAVANCESLVSLSLECTSTDTEGVTALADALLAAPVQSLTELDLSDNQLSQVEAATALAHTVARSVLQVLRLNRNPLGDAGTRELADALDPELCPGGALQHLELNSCRVGTAGVGHLLNCLLQNETLRILRLGDNFLDDTLDMTLVDQLTHIQELQLVGNRLSHNALQRAAQACARNRQLARDKDPAALRTEMHRLLFQETKLTTARHQVSEDEAEITSRQDRTEQAANELRHLRSTQAENQRQLKRQISQEQEELNARREQLVKTNSDLESSARRYEELQRERRQTLKKQEQELVELQAQSDHVDKLLERRKVEHPQEVASIKSRVATAHAEAAQLQEAARDMRQQLKALQDKSLIDFRP